MKIDGKELDMLIIAEIGHNHQGSVEKCKDLFVAAKKCGCDAVKLQKRDNKTLYTKTAYNKPYDNPNSFGKTYGEHREALEFGFDEYLELQQCAKEIDIIFFATAFDILSADFLRRLGMPAYKIPSALITDTLLIEHIAAFGKPVFVSTGGAAYSDVDRVSNILVSANIDHALLHCVSTYPNKPDDINLNNIKTMLKRYPRSVIGFSDHYNGICMSEAAYLMGARIIEKHFTLNHTSKGTDHALSLEPHGMMALVRDIERLGLAMGTITKKILPEEVLAIEKMGKAIYPLRGIKKGEILTNEDIGLKSPGGGLPPYRLQDVINKIAINDLSTGVPMEEDDFK